MVGELLIVSLVRRSDPGFTVADVVSYDDETSISSHFNLCKLTVSELLESRFDIEGFQTNKIAQRALSAGELMGFELSEDWFASFCGKLGKDLERQLETKFGDRGFRVAVDVESFSMPQPTGLEDAPKEVQEYAAELWQEETVNPVSAALLSGPTC